MVSFWMRAFTLWPYLLTDLEVPIVILLSLPSARASPLASRKVQRKSKVSCFQLSRIRSGTSWYHFKASPFNTPWKIRCFAASSSWLAKAVDSNSVSQSSTSWLPSPLNPLYLRRVVEGMSSLSSKLDSLLLFHLPLRLPLPVLLNRFGLGVTTTSTWSTTTCSSFDPDVE